MLLVCQGFTAMELAIQNVIAVLRVTEVLMEKMAVNLAKRMSGQLETLTITVECA